MFTFMRPIPFSKEKQQDVTSDLTLPKTDSGKEDMKGGLREKCLYGSN